MTLQPTRGLYLYLETLRVAFDDAIVTNDEAEILHILAQALGAVSYTHLTLPTIYSV